MSAMAEGPGLETMFAIGFRFNARIEFSNGDF
jgi:hypothetical protein